MFGTGLITYLCSKEIYVMEHEFYNGISLAIIVILAVKKMGPAAAKFADEGIDVSFSRVPCLFATTDCTPFP